MLWVIPNFLFPSSYDKTFPDFNKRLLSSLDHFAVENKKDARAFLNRTLDKPRFTELSLFSIGKKGSLEEYQAAGKILTDGKEIGLLSDAGMPCIADPGQNLVRFAHQNNIKVNVLIGPSSIPIALAGSGLNGQNFHFHGYLDRDKAVLSKQIKQLEQESRKTKTTQIFIETPYRNEAIFEQLTKTLADETQLCLAANLMAPNQFLKTQFVKEWRKQKPKLTKIPCVFLFKSN